MQLMKCIFLLISALYVEGSFPAYLNNDWWQAAKVAGRISALILKQSLIFWVYCSAPIASSAQHMSIHCGLPWAESRHLKECFNFNSPFSAALLNVCQLPNVAGRYAWNPQSKFRCYPWAFDALSMLLSWWLWNRLVWLFTQSHLFCCRQFILFPGFHDYLFCQQQLCGHCIWSRCLGLSNTVCGEYEASGSYIA